RDICCQLITVIIRFADHTALMQGAIHVKEPSVLVAHFDGAVVQYIKIFCIESLLRYSGKSRRYLAPGRRQVDHNVGRMGEVAIYVEKNADRTKKSVLRIDKTRSYRSLKGIDAITYMHILSFGPYPPGVFVCFFV